MASKPDPIETALALAPFPDAQRRGMARETRALLERWKRERAEGWHANAPHPRERAERLRAVAAAARAAACAGRELDEARAGLFPPDNMTALLLAGELQGQRGATVTLTPVPEGHPARLLREAPAPERWAALDTLADGAARLAARLAKRPGRAGNPRNADAWSLTEECFFHVWGVEAFERGGKLLDEESPFEAFMLAVFNAAGVQASVGPVRRALKALAAELGPGFQKSKRTARRNPARRRPA